DLLSRQWAANLPGPALASPLTALAGTLGLAQAVAGGPEPSTAGSQADSPAAALSRFAALAPAQAVNQTDLQIDIAGLTLRGGQIHLHDKKRGYIGHLTNLELNTGRITADQPFDVAFRGQL